MSVSPILLFTYKRLDTLKQTVEALKDNYLALESELFIFSDAAKNDADLLIVNEVRQFIHSIEGFKKITIIESVLNKGLASSIIYGVNLVFENFDKVIVLEDDLSTTKNFLSFMNCSLNLYKKNSEAFSISGYSFDLGKSPFDNYDGYFINRGWSWGWATWKDRWISVDWEVKDYEEFTRNDVARRAFSKGGSDLNKMLDEQMSGKLDSWAIRWFYNQFRTNRLTVYPVYSKIFNNGFDEFATHTNGSRRRYLPILDIEENVNFNLPSAVKIDHFYQRQFNKKMGLLSRIISKVETILQRILKKNLLN